MSAQIPASTTAEPVTPWPPPYTDKGRFCSRARFTTATTSSASVQRAIMTGRRSIMPLKTCRASS
jgi:hypothetical protein